MCADLHSYTVADLGAGTFPYSGLSADSALTALLTSAGTLNRDRVGMVIDLRTGEECNAESGRLAIDARRLAIRDDVEA